LDVGNGREVAPGGELEVVDAGKLGVSAEIFSMSRSKNLYNSIITVAPPCNRRSKWFFIFTVD
jgi:hypothetical protein